MTKETVTVYHLPGLPAIASTIELTLARIERSGLRKLLRLNTAQICNIILELSILRRFVRGILVEQRIDILIARYQSRLKTLTRK